jgi:hypothetical protein
MPIPVLADSPAGEEATDDTVDAKQEAGEPSILGTWISTVTNATTGQVFHSMSTFLPGGDVIEDNNGSHLRTVGQGQWQRLGPLEYLRTWTNFTYSSCFPCVYSGLGKNVQIIELSEDGKTFTANSYGQSYDTNGVLLTNNYNPSNGRRCNLGTSAAYCLGIGR